MKPNQKADWVETAQPVSQFPPWFRDIPILISLTFLIIQTALPWMAPYFVTMDGPAHVYTAVVLRALLLDHESLFGSVYTWTASPPTNWGTAVLINLLLLVLPPGHVEQALASLCIILGVACCAYLLRAISRSLVVYSPLLNILASSWFLWIGFYNFYLGFMLGLAAVAYCIPPAR
ncbi:MAG: hypothetical protein ACK5AZ_26480 [Bryobacteraceae bacterium]